MTNSVKGECPNCKQQNDYSLSFCGFCGNRLPWADAIIAQKNQAASAQLNEQERLAGRLNTGMDKGGQRRDAFVQATKDFANSPEFKEAAAKEAQSWSRFAAFAGGCLGIAIVLTILFFIVAMVAS